MKLKRLTKPILLSILIPLITCIGCGLRFTTVDGCSMEPTFVDGDVLVTIDAWGLKEGDIVTFITPESDKYGRWDRLRVKRIQSIRNNGTKEFFLVSDNQLESYDSRHYGWVGWSNICRKVVFALGGD